MSDSRLIASRHNPVFKAFRALADDPRQYGRALLDGIHLVTSCLAHGITPRQLLVSESGRRNPDVAALLNGAAGVECVILRDGLFREISGVSTPIGIAAVIDIPGAIGRCAGRRTHARCGSGCRQRRCNPAHRRCGRGA
jgi:TrmH family RNA methyltransferase